LGTDTDTLSQDAKKKSGKANPITANGKASQRGDPHQLEDGVQIELRICDCHEVQHETPHNDAFGKSPMRYWLRIPGRLAMREAIQIN
jgi:hypothetical protein